MNYDLAFFILDEKKIIITLTTAFCIDVLRILTA